MPATGIEPVRVLRRGILSPLCLPIPPCRHGGNGLVEELGGKPTPGVGFGLGLERLLMVLETQGLLPESKSDIKLYVSNIGEDADLFAQKLVNELRLQGISAEKDHMSRSLKAQMKYADKIGAEYTVVIGDEEIKNGFAVLKNMSTGEQREIEFSNLKEALDEGF